MDRLPEKTARAWAKAIRRGEATPLDAVEACLAAFQSREEAVRAWVLVDAEAARAEAARLTEKARNGSFRGPLHGVPVGIKDIIDVAGWPTRAGSEVTTDAPASSDAVVVERLRAAGAIVLGKTVTTEFACFDPAVTHNPWNAERTPGGSSSGSAAAVATTMCPIAVGSQTGGSIVRPASYCGVCGLKPTFGTVSTEGVVPVSGRLDHVGPMAGCVEDLRIALAAMRNGGAGEGGTPAQDRGGADRRRIRLGVWREFFFDVAAADVANVVDGAISTLVEAGAEVVDATLPEMFDPVHVMHKRIMAYDAARVHRARFAEQAAALGPNLRELIEAGLATSEAEYAEATAYQEGFRTTMDAALGNCDAVMTPSTVTTAPGRDTTGDPRFNSPFSLSGQPTVTIPCGLGEDGMPVGLQLVGKSGTDARLLDAAAWCEAAIGFGDLLEREGGGR